MITVISAATALMNAIVIATSPRLAHPRTVLGIATLIKNSTDIIDGKTVC
jgi:hypothetical protein